MTLGSLGKKIVPCCVIGIVAIGITFSCGGANPSFQVDSNPGEFCTEDQFVCVSFPVGALKQFDTLTIQKGVQGPEAPLSDTYEISLRGLKGEPLEKPARVSFHFDAVQIPENLNETLLKVFTKENDEWVPLENPSVNRTTKRISGDTKHFSPFVIMRIDRLSDGGVPIAGDSGVRDSGIIVFPFDAGGVDAGRPDAGRPDSGIDSGVPDAGIIDAGFDAGIVDSGIIDAGIPDSGIDAGRMDAGIDAGIDAGRPDAGIDAGIDSGVPDAGVDAGFDAGQLDAGVLDAGTDAGIQDSGTPDAGDAG
jgi:hypothetical protein